METSLSGPLLFCMSLQELFEVFGGSHSFSYCSAFVIIVCDLLCILLEISLLSFFFFYSLKKNGRLRVNLIYEIIGLDFIKHQTKDEMNEKNLEEEHRNEFLRKVNNHRT